MAKKVQIVTDAEVPEGAPAPPTLAAAAEASQQAEADRLAELLAKAGTPAPPKTDAPPAKTPDEEYDEWEAALPADKRDRFRERTIQRQAEGLAEFYGPEISQVLTDVAADPELKKMLGRMSDKKAREWVQKTAMAIYDDERFASPTAADGPVREDPRVEELGKEVRALKKRDEDRDAAAALESLRRERVALENTFPELRWTDLASKEYKRVLAVVEETQDRRAAGKPVSMADVYAEYKDMWDWQGANPPPKPAPATSSREVTGPQAPRTKFESRAAINAQLDKHGSIGQLAAALKR